MLEPQKTIHTPQASYRADLFVYVTTSSPQAEPIQWGPTVIEVDGHEFHERTREQASHDRKRDRDMLREGLRVVRFTGSDVFNRPFDCADEINELLSQTAREVLETYRVPGRLAELMLNGDSAGSR